MYQSQSNGVRQVLGTGLAVGAIQLGIASALLATFAGGAIHRLIHPALTNNRWIDVPPPPPSPTPVARPRLVPRADTFSAPVPPIDPLARPVMQTPEPLTLLPTLPGLDRGALSLNDPYPPLPPRPAVGAQPLGNPGLWITPDDYPARALRESWSGVTRLKLAIGDDGRVTACTVTASSGHDALDAVACARVTERARFSPARDGTGARRTGTYNSAIRWQIQDQ